MSASSALRAVLLVWPLLLAGSMLRAETPSTDWSTFRGRDRTGVSNEAGLLSAWPEGGPKLLWETRKIGRGYSSLSFAGGKVYTAGDQVPDEDENAAFLLCLNREDGKILWKTRVGDAWNSGKTADWHGTRSTPSVDGDIVCIVTPQGVLTCCDSQTGKVKWQKTYSGDFGGKKGDSWGYGESVLIDGDRVICTPGGEKTTMAALNRNTGEVIWTTVRNGDRGAGHSSAVISEIGGVKVYVQTTASGPIGVRAADGQLLWEFPIPQITAVIPSPLVRGDTVFFTAGYGTGAGALLKQVPAGDGKVNLEVVYPLKAALKSRQGGVVLIGDYIYADTDMSGTPFCAELATGEIKWRKRGRGGNADLVAAGDRLYILYQGGTMVLAKADPEDYVEISSFKVPGSGQRPSWAHPAIHDGKLYIREHDRVLCYDVKK